MNANTNVDADTYTDADEVTFTAEDVKTALQAEGDLPELCTLPAFLVLACGMRHEDPCSGCNEDRAVCGGRPKGRRLPSPRLLALIRLAGCAGPWPGWEAPT